MLPNISLYRCLVDQDHSNYCHPCPQLCHLQVSTVATEQRFTFCLRKTGQLAENMPALERAETEHGEERANEIQDVIHNVIQDESVTTTAVMMRPQTSSFHQRRKQLQSDMKVVFFVSNQLKCTFLIWTFLTNYVCDGLIPL